MTRVEIWSNASGRWYARLIDPVVGMPDRSVFEENSRGGIIALMLHWLPLSHLEFWDRFNPIDP